MKNVFAYSLVMIALCIPANLTLAQGNSEAKRIADLEQDVQALKEQIGQMRISMEELQRQNQMLRVQAGRSGQNAANNVTESQLDTQLANLRAEITRAQIAQKNEIIDEVGRQMDRLAHQTQQALQAQTSVTTSDVSFSDNFPKTGVPYTVQKGDTLSGIARKMGATVEDIRNANRIINPGKLLVGQVLFIPQRSK